MAKPIKVPTQIKSGSKELNDLMRAYLGEISDAIIQQIMRRARRATPAQRINAVKDLSTPGVNEYKANLLEALAALSADSIGQARVEVPRAKNVKLSEFDNLPAALKKKLKARNELLVGKQVGDLLKTIQFAYATNEDTTDSDDLLEQDLKDSALGWLDGTSIQAGAELTASSVIAEARDLFFDDEEVSDEIVAFEFVNADPVTEICNDLAGTVFEKDDPDRFRYTPPLHWNCKSWIRPLLSSEMVDKALTRNQKKFGRGGEIEKLKPSSKKIEDTIQFDEYEEDTHHA